MEKEVLGFLIFREGSQPAITCSKLTKETLQQGVKYVQTRTILLTLNIFHTLF